MFNTKYGRRKEGKKEGKKEKRKKGMLIRNLPAQSTDASSSTYY
jgi:hypothetical protein